MNLDLAIDSSFSNFLMKRLYFYFHLLFFFFLTSFQFSLLQNLCQIYNFILPDNGSLEGSSDLKNSKY